MPPSKTDTPGFFTEVVYWMLLSSTHLPTVMQASLAAVAARLSTSFDLLNLISCVLLLTLAC